MTDEITILKEKKLANLLEEYPDFVYRLKNPSARTNYSELRDDGYGKVRYETKEEAERALSSCRRERKHGKGKRKECAVYQDDDGGWYLTSKRKDRKRMRTQYSNKHQFSMPAKVYGNKQRRV